MLSHLEHPQNIGKLEYLMEAANLMIVSKKGFGEQAQIEEMFTKLSTSQIYHLLAYFQPSKLSPSAVSASVLNKIRGWGNIEFDVEKLML